jgi:hypothetical protein
MIETKLPGASRALVSFTPGVHLPVRKGVRKVASSAASTDATKLSTGRDECLLTTELTSRAGVKAMIQWNASRDAAEKLSKIAKAAVTHRNCRNENFNINNDIDYFACACQWSISKRSS